MEKEYEFCIKCGRKLKSPESRVKGMGKICEKKSIIHTDNALFDIYNKDKEGKIENDNDL